MTTLLSSRGTIGGRTRWLLLNQCEGVDPEADCQPPPPPRPAPHHPPAPPPLHRAPPPPQSPILRRRRSPQALQPLSPPTPQPPPPLPAQSSPRPEKWNVMKLVTSYCKMV
jgi:hypothetical protein